MTSKNAYISNELQLQNHSSTFFLKNNSFPLTTSIQSPSLMAHNTTVSLDKMTCTDFVDFAKIQNRFGQFSMSKTDSKYLDIKLKSFTKDDNEEFRLAQHHRKRAADFNQIMQLRNQLVIAAENFAKERILSPIVIPTLSQHMDRQLKLAHKLVDVVDRASNQKKLCESAARFV